jgi:hypothetical protein
MEKSADPRDIFDISNVKITGDTIQYMASSIDYSAPVQTTEGGVTLGRPVRPIKTQVIVNKTSDGFKVGPWLGGVWELFVTDKKLVYKGTQNEFNLMRAFFGTKQ